jgi:hypothetical protein
MIPSRNRNFKAYVKSQVSPAAVLGTMLTSSHLILLPAIQWQCACPSLYDSPVLYILVLVPGWLEVKGVYSCLVLTIRE